MEKKEKNIYSIAMIWEFPNIFVNKLDIKNVFMVWRNLAKNLKELCEILTLSGP